MMIPERYRQYLLALKADQTKHSGRDLYSHLVGTYELLKAWGNKESVCAAGLFHSAYGTKHFKHRSTNAREGLRTLIGEYAELLVYLFCVTERPRAFLEAMQDSVPVLRSFRSGGDLHVQRGVLCHLLEIEAANLLEQRSTGPWLDRILQTPDGVSDVAKDSIRKYLAARTAAESSHAGTSGARPGADVDTAGTGRLADAG